MRTGITAEMGAPIVAARERVAESVMPAAPATPPSRVTSAPRALRLKTAPFAKLNALPRDGKPVTEWENRQIHVAAFTTRVDDSTRHHRAVTFGGALYPPENRYDLVDRDVIQRLSTARARTE
jgi:hypothetical protein